jgi:pyruvate dehydrogenase E2 component (dihydrolipoamide acetyltransferase)
MIQNVLLPKLGETMTAAKVEKWRKAVGDKVAKGDVILEITTDKATLEVESIVQGTLRAVLAPEGVELPVNTVIALVGDPSDALPANLADLEAAARGGAPAKPVTTAPGVATAIPAPSSAAAQASDTAVEEIVLPAGRVFASPRARMRAEAEHVPLLILRGSGPNARILEQDVLAYVERRAKVKATPTAIAEACARNVDITRLKPTGADGRVTKEDVLAAKPGVAAVVAQPPPAVSVVAQPPSAVGPRIELTAMRRVVAERMTRSKREAPHFYLMMDIDMTAAAALRSKINAEGKLRIAFHDLALRACAKALVENPAMNVTWAGDHIRRRDAVNIGLAVALDEGLIVPVVKNVDRMSLVETAQASAKLVEKARSKRLTPDEYEGGCLTLSNLGMYDVDNFCPVINPGESGILGTGRITQKVVVIDGGLHVRSMMSVTLSADHRAVDGAIAAKFLKRVKELLQAPESL